MNNYSSARDLTLKQPMTGGGSDMRMSFVACGHKGLRAGALMKGHMPWRCAACVAKGKA